MNKHPSTSRVRRTVLTIAATSVIASACGSDSVAFDDVPAGSVLLFEADDVVFTEISPFATFGSAQGNFGEGAHSTFGIFGAGASSPPHTHSSDYYAVVLEGPMNNPFGVEAEPAELAPGSFWTVPANDEHVTACLTPDSECRFFFHAKAAFDFTPLETMTQERSADAASIPAAELNFEALDPYAGAATVWGDPSTGPFGSILRIDAGEDTGDLAYRHGLSLVPMTGGLSAVTSDGVLDLPVGSLLEAEPNAVHELRCEAGDACTIYAFAEQPREIRTG